jgi:hypothetical protein
VRDERVVLKLKKPAKKFVEEFTNVKGKLKKIGIKRIKDTIEMEHAIP